MTTDEQIRRLAAVVQYTMAQLPECSPAAQQQLATAAMFQILHLCPFTGLAVPMVSLDGTPGTGSVAIGLQ